MHAMLSPVFLGNEKEVGDGIKASGVERSSFFLTTKLDNPHHQIVPEALETSLKKLDTPYLDLCTYASSYTSGFH